MSQHLKGDRWVGKVAAPSRTAWWQLIASSALNFSSFFTVPNSITLPEAANCAGSASQDASKLRPDGAELARWLQHCQARLHDGVGGGLTLAQFFERIDAPSETADERGEAILATQYSHAEATVPRAP